MSRLPITIATWDYDRVRALVDERVRVEGGDVNYLTMPVFMRPRHGVVFWYREI